MQQPARSPHERQPDDRRSRTPHDDRHHDPRSERSHPDDGRLTEADLERHLRERREAHARVR
jgi:hypothetical protein